MIVRSSGKLRPEPAGATWLGTVPGVFAPFPRLVRLAVVTIVTLVVSGGCSSADEAVLPVPDTPPQRVVLVGDSLAQEAAPYLKEAIAPMTISAHYFAGTAPCDWTGEDLELDGAVAAVVSFSGNALTACMTDEAGQPLQGDALVERYRADVASLVGRSLEAGATVVIVGQPANGVSDDANRTVDELNTVYNELAVELGAGFVDAGAAVEALDGSFVRELPCRSVDPECPASGVIVVRSDDGGHFCPGAAAPGSCPVHSSGASRFADAIAVALGG